MRTGKIVAIVIGVLLILIGLALLVPGSILLWLNGVADGQGYLNTSTHTLQTSGYALVTPDVKLELGSGDWIPGDWAIQIKARSTSNTPLFVGVGPTDDVMNYLRGVAYDEVTNIGWFSSGRTEYRHVGGDGGPPPPPGQQNFWSVEQEGAGAQSLQWHIRSGNWTAVVMNADGSADLAADVSLGAHLAFLLPLGIGLTVGGVVLLAVGIFLVIFGARRPRRPDHLAPGYPGGPPQSQPFYGQQPYGQQPYGQQPPPAPAPYQPPPPAAPPDQPAPGPRAPGGPA